MENFPLVDIIIKGGWVMAPLCLCSLICVAVIAERLLWGPRRERVAPSHLFRDILNLVTNGRFDEALGACRASNSPLGRVLQSVIANRQRSREEIMEAAEFAGKREVIELQKRLAILSVIAAVSPLLGLLGTVSGMIHTFTSVSQVGIGNPMLLAGGISEALITTAAGLTIAIPALLFHRFFIHQSKHFALQLEDMAFATLEEISLAGQNTSPNQAARSDERHLRATIRNL